MAEGGVLNAPGHERELVLFGRHIGEVTETSLVLPENLSRAKWERIGKELRRVEGATQWWIGDWWNYPAQYGERKAIVEANEDLPAFQSCVNAGNVAAKIETNRRRLLVPWSVHAEVAALEPDQQDTLLAEAEREKVTVREVRAKVRALFARRSILR